MGRIATLSYAALTGALGLWPVSSGAGLTWPATALGLFCCGLGLRILGTGLWRGAGQSGMGTLRLMRAAFALYLASGLAAAIAAFAHLQLAAAIIASIFLSLWIWLWAGALVLTRKSPESAAKWAAAERAE